MKIYLNGRYLTQHVTGVQRYSHELLKSIDAESQFARRFELTLLVPSRGSLFDPGFRNIALRKVGRLGGHAWEQLELPRYSEDGMLFCPGNTAPLQRLYTGRPTVVTLHSLSYKLVPSAYTLSYRILYGVLVPIILRHAQAVITVSASESAAILRHYPFVGSKLVAIQNGGFGSSMSAAIPSIPPKEVGFPYGLYVGSLNAAKNVAALVEAVARLLHESGTGFVFVGGAHAALRRASLAIPSEAKQRLIFAGQVNDQRELIGWYKGAQFLAFPSLYEASPLPPIEAMSCGCPVIASSIPAMRERCGSAALYCDAQSVEDISSAMISLARDPALRSGLIEAGMQRAGEYSWSRCAAATLAVLERVANEGARE